MPNFAALTALADRACMDHVGEIISYSSNGMEANYADVPAEVDYRDAQTTLDRSEVVHQANMVLVLIADVPAKPSPSARVKLPKRPGRTYAPVSPRRDESGTGWEFDTQDVTDA